MNFHIRSTIAVLLQLISDFQPFKHDGVCVFRCRPNLRYSLDLAVQQGLQLQHYWLHAAFTFYGIWEFFMPPFRLARRNFSDLESHENYPNNFSS